MKNLKAILPIYLWPATLFLVISCTSQEVGPPPLPTSQTPAISSIEPDQGKYGAVITISGLNFGGSITDNTVSFNGTPAVVISASETRLEVEVPRGAGNGPIRVATSAGVAASQDFTYLLTAVVETIAGTGEPGFQDGSGDQSQLNRPRGIFIKADGTLLIADSDNHAIRQWSNGIVSTVVKAASTIEPVDVHVNRLEDIYVTSFNRFGFLLKITDEFGRKAFKEVADSDHMLHPLGITSNRRGHPYVTDLGFHALYFLFEDNGRISDTYGSAGQPGYQERPLDQAQFSQPSFIRCVQNLDLGVKMLVLTEQGNHTLRTVDLSRSRTTNTLAGSGQPGFADGPGDEARFNSPRGLDLDDGGNIFVADFLNNAIHKVTPQGKVTTILKSEGEVSAVAEPQLIDGLEGVARFQRTLRDCGGSRWQPVCFRSVSSCYPQDHF